MNICSFCKSHGPFEEKTFMDVTLYVCSNCFEISRVCCRHTENRIVTYDYFTRLCCKKCYKIHGTFLKRANFSASDLTAINKTDYDNYEKQISESQRNFEDEISLKRRTIRIDKYREYLLSDEWKERRNKVFKRDNYICQSCLINKATEVHHLKYDHKFNEPCFELVSICGDCHKKITDLDNLARTL